MGLFDGCLVGSLDGALVGPAVAERYGIPNTSKLSQ